MRHLLLALMGLLLLSVDVSALEPTLPNQVETVLRRRHEGHRCHRRRHHSSCSSTNVIVGPTGPRGPTGSLASSYASVFNSSETGQPIGSILNPSVIVFNQSELPPVNIITFSSSTVDPGTFDTLQVQTSGIYLIGWKLNTAAPDSGLSGVVQLFINNNPLDSTEEIGRLSSATIFAGQTIIRLNAGDTIQLVASGQDAIVSIPSLVVTQIAQ